MSYETIDAYVFEIQGREFVFEDDDPLREAFCELDEGLRTRLHEPGSPEAELHRRLGEALFPEEVVVRFNGEVAEALATPLMLSLLAKSGASKDELELLDIVKGLL